MAKVVALLSDKVTKSAYAFVSSIRVYQTFTLAIRIFFATLLTYSAVSVIQTKSCPYVVLDSSAKKSRVSEFC